MFHCTLEEWEGARLECHMLRHHSPSHISIAVRGAGTVAAQAERLKMAKCEHLDSSH